MSKAEKMAQSLLDYVKAHPEQRFWQSVRNWTQVNIDADVNFILFGGMNFNMKQMQGDSLGALDETKDTFYAEDIELGPTRD